MTLNIDAIIAAEVDAYSKWKNHLFSKDCEEKILYLLSPLINYVKTKITLEASHFSRILLTEDYSVQIVLYYFKTEISPLIIRIFVTELHQAKKSKALLKNTKEARFDEFVELMGQTEALTLLLRKYHVLKENLSISLQQFLQLISEFLQRFNHDYLSINKFFFNRLNSTLSIVDILFAGDKHSQGKRVMIVTLMEKKERSLYKLVYKPRDLKLAQSFECFITWVNENTHFKFKHPRTLYQRNYAWQEYIEYKPCNSRTEVSYFFYHLGGLLAIFYLLNSLDIHSENIISNGQDPILIDCECLLTPVITNDQKIKPHIRNLVCSSLVLPTRTMTKQNYSGYENSVIGQEEGQILPFKILSWKQSGTDEMILEKVIGKTFQHKSRPVLNEKLVNPLHYEKYFLKGFRILYNFFLKHAKSLLCPMTSPLNVFTNCITRVILRPTHQYAQLLLESFHPSLLHQSKLRYEHFKFLQKSIRLSPEYSYAIPSELRDLMENNIPIFFCNTQSSTINDSYSQPLSLQVSLSPLDHVKYNLKSFWGKDDLLVQNTLICNSFKTLQFNSSALKFKKNITIQTPNNKNSYILSIRKIILRMGQQIYQRVIQDNDFIHWPTLDVVGNKLTSSVTNDTFHNGNLGIIYILALVGHYYSIEEYKILSLNYIVQLVSRLIKGESIYNCIGLYEGLGGVIYVAVQLNRLLGSFISKNLINSCLSKFESIIDNYPENYDVSSGYAGFLKALLVTKDDLCLEFFKRYSQICENKLMEISAEKENLLSHELYLASYLHGVTGIYSTLIDLYRVTNNQNLIPTIQRLNRYEEDFFNLAESDWIDNRKNFQGKKILQISKMIAENKTKRNGISNNKTEFNKKPSVHAWCHGAVGIGLARLYANDNGILGNKNQMFINNALQATIKYSFQNNNDNLCHGYSGSLEFLHSVYIKDPGLLKEYDYQNKFKDFLIKIEKNNLSFYGLKNLFVPGLFDGLSGVIYFLLRFIYPELPSVLIPK